MTNVKVEGATSPPVDYTDYVSLLKARIPELTKATLVIQNSHATQSIFWKVLVSNDPEGADGTFGEDKAEAELTGESVERHVITGPFVWVDVQIHSDDDEDSPQASVWLLGVG